MGILSGFKCPFGGKQKRGKSDPGRFARVGWLVDTPSAGLIYGTPSRVRSESVGSHPKSASRCPAVIDLEARYFQIPCPHDIHLRVERGKDGKWALVNLAGEKGGVRPNKLKSLVHMVGEREWRHPDRPMLQVNAPYRFVADEPVYITQCGPFLDYPAHAWPGLVFGGRFPVDVWPRVLMWAFEWHDPSRPLLIRRGQPWFYVTFELADPSRQVKLVEAEMTPQLRQYVSQIDGVTNFTNRTFSLFNRAASLRPKVLLKERQDRYASEVSLEAAE